MKRELVFLCLLSCASIAGGAPVKSLGRLPSAVSPAPSRSICDVASEAAARNSPATPDLESQCRAVLATRGEAIANRDPLAAELRRRVRDDASRRGFDLGMAVAENDSLPGPGKQKIHDKLAGAEQAAYDEAVSFLLQRNGNSQLNSVGAMISGEDPGVGQARESEDDVFFWPGRLRRWKGPSFPATTT